MILITGANGFIGGACVARLVLAGRPVRAVVRQTGEVIRADIQYFQVEDIAANTDWSRGLEGVDTIIHAAARVHMMNDAAVDPLSEFRRINVLGTLNLARQAAATGVRRFVFISSVKVLGEETLLGHPFTPDDVPAPQDAYGISKWEAEQGLKVISAKSGMQVVIIRPPLVYGPGVGANFDRLIRAVELGVPLPLGAIQNRRSLVALDNLVDLIVLCLDHPGAANEIFLVRDEEDLSTPELICRLAGAMNRSPHLISLPAWLLGFGAWLLGRTNTLQRLRGSLQVDMTKTMSRLGWKPLVSVNEALREIAMARKR